MNLSGRLAGLKALVTGSGTGIGRGIAEAFAGEGADVAVHYAHSGEGAEAVAGVARELGVRCEAFAADFTKLPEVLELAGRVSEFLGGVDILVNNAGITMNLPFERVTPEQYDVLMQVNLRSPYFLTQSLLPHLLESNAASVINITSIHAFEGYPEHSVYASTKGAIVAQSRELAIELAPKGIRVNAIAPGSVVVENHYKVIDGFDPVAAGKGIPAGFIGEPADIAKLAVFLASADSRYVVGQTIVADGGTTSWMPFGDGYKAASRMSFGKDYVPGLGGDQS